jgi:glycosyltransferase involved in cell wall biosynthesis
MRVVLCNKYFFLNGGTERYFRNCLDRMPSHGIEAVPYSVAYANSWESPYARFFLPPPGRPEETHYHLLRPTPRTLLRLAGRAVYSLEAQACLARLLDHLGSADIGYVLSVYNYMSASIVRVFKRRGIPVVVRFGDYNALCANYSLLRDGKPCELCVRGNYLHGIRHRCVKGKLSTTLLRTLGLYVQRGLRLFLDADAVVAPCGFMRDRLVEGGFAPQRIHVVRQPATAIADITPRPKGNYILYFGRVSPEKGLDTLIAAYQKYKPDVELRIVGRTYGSYGEQLRELAARECADRIRFIDFLAGEELAECVSGALLSIMPSRCYDNAPLALYESYALGVPVLAAAIGGIPEQVLPGRTGELFAPDSVDDLGNRLSAMLADPARLAWMGAEAREFARNELSMDSHLKTLEGLFSGLILARRHD